MTLSHAHAKNPLVLSEILETVKKLENQGIEPTFNTILNELSTKRILAFHRSLRKYLNLLVFGKVLAVRYEKASQPNIREKQVYHTNNDEATLEAGEKALLLHGLNWDLPFPKSVRFKTDLQALALGTVSGDKVYASLEDTVVQSLKVRPRRTPDRSPELLVFATALLATQKIDFNYLVHRAKEAGIEKEIIRILDTIDKTFSSKNPDVEDIFTLYKLRSSYAQLRKPLLKVLREAPAVDKGSQPITPNQVVEYAGKQLGLKG